MTQENIFLKACRREKTPYTPVWIMRQAGRYMKEYRAIRDKVPFLELCKNKDLVTEVTVTAQEKIKADAAIIFSDILLIVEAFGLGLNYLKHEGPSIGSPIRSPKAVETMRPVDVQEAFSFVLKAIGQTKRALKPGIALIGFAGAPFTVASYMIEGGGTKNFLKTRGFMKRHPKAWNQLLDKIGTVTAKYLKAQITSGADAVQVFDSWVGILSPTEYRKNVFPHSQKLFLSIKGTAPVISFGTGTALFLKDFSEAGGDVIGVDHRIRLDRALKKIKPKQAIQGNLDPQILLKKIPAIKKQVRIILDQAGGRPGHIFNLGHGILPETPVEHAIAVVEMVHELSQKKDPD